MNKIFFMRYLKSLQKAFEYWIKTWFFQIIASTLFFGLLSIFSAKALQFFNLSHFPAFLDSVTSKPIQKNDLIQLINNLNFSYFILSLVLIFACLFPLNIGLMNIYKKIDEKEKFKISDLFIGYIGNNFFKYSLSFLLWYFILSLLSALHSLLSIAWILFSIMVIPIMFFFNVGLFQAIKLSFISTKNNIGITFFLTITMLLFYLFVFTLIPLSLLLISFFWTSIAYTLYKEIFIVIEKH